MNAPSGIGQRTAAWIVTLASVLAGALVWPLPHHGAQRAGVATLFSVRHPGIPVVIPTDAVPAERVAAEMLSETLAKSAGRSPAFFPIRREGIWTGARAVFVGETHHAGAWSGNKEKPPFDTEISVAIRVGAVVLRSERRESVGHAASWFLEKHLGAHWFIPGPLGEFVPLRNEVSLPAGQTKMRPGFMSRDVSPRGPGAQEWSIRNRLEARIDHGHNLANIFRPEDFARAPEMAPMRKGVRYVPPAGTQNWQPNMLSQLAVQHTADVAMRAFAADPKRMTFSLSENDGVRFDDSAATLAAVSPPRFFRSRPDYSNLVFKFTNEVAEIVAKKYPDRWLPAYAYYWCENTPDFPIARNVVPFLTADRSRWSFPEYAAEDRALIDRWCRSGAGLVGIYDYFYGAPFLVPRPILYAVQESIPFEYQAGARAFYAESSPNWALDGPKSWLAAQLLWSPETRPAELLEIYYREFWAEAAEPMRAFFDVCERVWREQPPPPLWLRYYADEDQGWVFPRKYRAELRALLAQAEHAASNPTVRARVALASTGLAVSESYWTFTDARERVSALARGQVDAPALMRSWQNYRAAREAFLRRWEDVQRDHPLAMATQNLAVLLRNQPDSRAARVLLATPAGRSLMEADADFVRQHLAAPLSTLSSVLTEGAECLADEGWRAVKTLPVGSSTTIDWTAGVGPWQGSGEPWQGRTVEMKDQPDGTRVLRMAGCRTDSISQWAAVLPGAFYAAQARVRAKSSPGTATYLIVSFLDEKQRHIGTSRIDRLNPDTAEQDVSLCVMARAPANACWIGFGLNAWNQINDDFAEFSGASLRQWVDQPAR